MRCLFSTAVRRSVGLTLFVVSVLVRIYGDKISANYSTTLSSLAFAGTVVGMLVFGYLSDKMGRKFGMVRSSDPVMEAIA